MPTKKLHPADVLRAIATSDDDLLDVNYPEALVDEELRAAGIDPREVDAKGEAFVERLMVDRADVARKASTTRLRSTTKKTTPSSLPPMRPKAPSDADSHSEE